MYFFLNKNALKHFVYGRDPHTINNKYMEHRKKKDPRNSLTLLLYCQCLCCPEKSIDQPQVTNNFSHNVVSNTHHHEQDSNSQPYW